jgi:uncharacterized protein (TIGR00661 family)
MTQAIAAAQTLERNGHEVVAVTIGANPGRAIPDYFRHAFGALLTPIASPGFSLQAGRGVAALGTLRQAMAGLGAYRRSLATLGHTIACAQPDLILNFLEPLMGVFNVLRPHAIPVVSVGHHFMLGHPEFVASRRFVLQQWSMRQYVRTAGARSTKLALSFYPAASLPERRLVVCPPLLRRELFDLPQDVPGRFLLAYVLNQGYAADIIEWHAAHPEVEVHCFCEKPGVEPVWHYDATLSFHQLDGTKFLRMMSESGGVACTAGFELPNEAAWLGKPLLVVPVENHVEQHLNALDVEKAGLAVATSRFDLTPLLHRQVASNRASYRAWVRRAGALFLSAIEEAARTQTRQPMPMCTAPALRATAICR